MNWRKQLPSMVTLGNAGAGFIACAFALLDRPELASLTILAAVLMDSLDGALARSLRAESQLGGELDSLADVISFGVAPALLTGSILPEGTPGLVWLVIAVYPLCATWRLARYNAAQSEEGSGHGAFTGLPSTGAGAAAATGALLYLRLAETGIPCSPSLLPTVMVALGALMVSRLPYQHASVLLGKLHLSGATLLAGVFVIGSVLWNHEYMFGALTWGYVVSAPVLTATHKIRTAYQP
jgi:CDP-diacylglycerol--serine O-phosphatidyltransferase